MVSSPPRRTGREDPLATARRAGFVDRDESVYARRRANLARKRAQLDRAEFDPGPPDDDDWTVAEEDTDGVRRVPAPQTVGDTLRNLVEQRGWSGALLASTIWTRWADIVGEELEDRCEPARLHLGVLTIRAYEQPWATQLKYLATVIRHRCDEVVGEGAVREIRVVIGAESSDENPQRHDT